MRSFALLLLAAVPTMAADPAPRVKVELAPKDGAWVGQRVTLAVTLATPDLFAGVPSFDMPAIPGTVILPPTGSPAVGSEQIGGDTFTTQRHEFAIYAQRPGTVRIPAFPIRFETNAGFGKPTVRRQVTTEEVSFAAKTPPKAEGLGTVIAARELKVTDVWEPEPKSPKVGDAFTRTVTVTAPDVPGMVFPPFRLDPSDGVAAYPKEPTVNDHTERGTLTGNRADAITFVCEQAGTVTIPDRTLTWFDLDAKELKTVKLPGRTFEVASNPTAAPPATPTGTPPSRTWSGWRWIIVAVGAAGLLGALFAVWGWPWLRRVRTDMAESEGAYFAHFRHACGTNDPHAVYTALLQWLDRFGPMTVEEFARQADDPELTQQLDALGNAAFGRPGSSSSPPDRNDLCWRVTAGRKKLTNDSDNRHSQSALPPLNPAR